MLQPEKNWIFKNDITGHDHLFSQTGRVHIHGNQQEVVTGSNDLKISALNNISDNIKSNDETELDKLQVYLQKRGLDFCSLAELLKKIELENIHKADAKYPDYGDKHMAMIDQLDAQSYRDLRKKYKLNKDMLDKVSIFAIAYCK